MEVEIDDPTLARKFAASGTEEGPNRLRSIPSVVHGAPTNEEAGSSTCSCIINVLSASASVAAAQQGAALACRRAGRSWAVCGVWLASSLRTLTRWYVTPLMAVMRI